MACDYVINQQISDIDENGRLIKVPSMALIDKRFRGMDSKQVFDILKQEQEQGGGQGQGDGEGQPLDDHMWQNAADMPSAEREALEKAIDQAIRQGEQLAGKLGGTSARSIGALPEPKVDWREQLRDFVTSVTSGRDTSTWRRPNRRWLANNTYMPSPYSEAVGELVIAVDTSGSIDEQAIGEFLAEVVSICDTVNPEKVTLLYWDTAVAAAEVYDQGSYTGLIASTRPAGGGGTDAHCVTDWLTNNNCTPELVIMLSDGYLSNGFPDFNLPTLWAMTSDIVAAHGVTIKLN